MLDRLRGKVRASGLENVETHLAGFLTYEHTGSPIDFVHSRLALHHLPDFFKAQALARIADWLCPGGVLRLSDVVFAFEPDEAPDRIESWCDSAPDVVEDPATLDTEWTRAELEEHVRDEHSTYTWLLEPMIERAGLRIEAADHSPDGIFADYLARKP